MRKFCFSENNEGTYYDAVEFLLQTLGKKEKDVEFIEYEKDEGIISKILGAISVETALENLLLNKRISLQ